MADPLLTKTSVTVRYTANDGYSSEQTFKIYPVDHNRLPPEQPLIDAVEELARLTALFGFEDKALAVFNEARQRVFDFRKAQAPNAELTGGASRRPLQCGVSPQGAKKMESETKRRERERLAFIENRDGRAGAVAFARQGIFVYRKALAQRNKNGKRCGYGQAYRRELVESCIVFRQFLRANAELTGGASRRPG